MLNAQNKADTAASCNLGMSGKLSRLLSLFPAGFLTKRQSTVIIVAVSATRGAPMAVCWEKSLLVLGAGLSKRKRYGVDLVFSQQDIIVPFEEVEGKIYII